ncbi:hypothetical protein L228DRAFT_212327 [Xylona heveae TC161]|uniref:Sexual development protein n=1 Tax=Xylona heveae (strain CBS 132557 / TC161) TaxID=1328760 RepID=A0A165FVG8_XYLHT|nr:hypothetical protein L228DRAFT_212327 [Xylona heveae TC161]KZF21429.1 hypothetical protein L228DRAFT_212327 [Xylona heveae TC161]
MAVSPALAAPPQAPLSLQDQVVAGGGVPDIPPPPSPLTKSEAQNIQLANFLENLEVNFFSQGLANITSWGVGDYPFNIVDIVTKIVAQEKVHVATFEDLLLQFGYETVPPCKYSFPVSNTEEFLALSNLITSVGIGAVIDLGQALANSNPYLVAAMESVVGVECRHDAFFRLTHNEVPNPFPFDTQIPGLWAFNLAHPFVIPGSCPTDLPLKVLPALNVVPAGPPAFAPQDRPTEIEFTFDQPDTPGASNGGETLYIAWVNQVRVPQYTQLMRTGNGMGTASLPSRLSGVVFAALTSTTDPDNLAALANATLAGPVIIPVS